MAQLMLNHRRKLKADMFEQTCQIGGNQLVYLCLLLRLAVLAQAWRVGATLRHERLAIVQVQQIA